MSILGWEARGLRCPDHSISLENGTEPTKVALLQMPNGTGKTTTLNLIRATLSGEHHTGGTWTREQVQSVRKLPSAATGQQPSTGEFKLTFEFDGRRYTMGIAFDFELGKAQYYHVTTNGNSPGYRTPHRLKPFLSLEFVHFFIFDGELAEHLLDPRKTTADEAIRHLFQLNKLDNMRLAAEGHWMEEAGKSKKPDNSLDHYKNKLLKTSDRLKQFELRLKNLTSEKRDLDARIIELENSIKGRFDDRDELGRRLHDLERRRAGLQQELQTASAQSLNLIRSPAAAFPHAVGNLSEFRESLDKVKLPESTSREFFRELAEESACVCGRPLDAQSRSAILDRSADYLGNDDVQFLNQMKDAIYQATQSRECPLMLQEQMASIRDLSRSIREADDDINDIMRRMGEADPEVAALREEEKLAHKRLALIDAEIRQLDSPQRQKIQLSDNHEQYNSIHELSTLNTLIRKRVEDLVGAVELKWKCEQIARILARAIESASLALQVATVAAANDTLDQLLPNNRIRIDKIDRCLKLRGQKAGSVGENLSVAYAFLSTIFRRNNQHSLPFVVDSPAGAIDADVRREVGALVPSLSHQFIAFTISTERIGFLDAVEASTHQDDIEYFTLFRLPNPEYATLVTDSMRQQRSGDGLVVQDCAFFKRFQDSPDAGGL